MTKSVLLCPWCLGHISGERFLLEDLGTPLDRKDYRKASALFSGFEGCEVSFNTTLIHKVRSPHEAAEVRSCSGLQLHSFFMGNISLKGVLFNFEQLLGNGLSVAVLSDFHILYICHLVLFSLLGLRENECSPRNFSGKASSDRTLSCLGSAFACLLRGHSRRSSFPGLM